MTAVADDLVDRLRATRAGRADGGVDTGQADGEVTIALVVAADLTGGPSAAALVSGPVSASLTGPDVGAGLDRIETALAPRWVWWSSNTPAVLSAGGLRVARCWDLAAVHRLIFGGWRADPSQIWAALGGLDPAAIPGMGQLDLLSVTGDDGGDLEHPVGPDGHLRAEWASGGWNRDPARRLRWAETAARAAELQRLRLTDARSLSTARSESAAELLCAELEADGLPVHRAEAERIIAGYIGPRPADEIEEARIRRARDAQVLQSLSAAQDVDLRNPAQVKALLSRVGIAVADTRSWRLEPYRGAHPVVDQLLRWRKAERIATTYGYRWLDERVDSDGRLRGAWSGSDGAAGRMTAQAGLHNLPADLRPAVVAEPGYQFVRADLGQIEPRVLAAVSGDPVLMAATSDADLYAPVAARLKVERPIAKVAVLAAMYGQTSGTAGEALRGLEQAYPVAMGYLRNAYECGRSGADVRTFGGRLIRMPAMPRGLDENGERSWLAGRARFARNAVIQGAAAEFFKAWAATLRTRLRAAGADACIVLCLHDELLVHVRADQADAVARLLHDCLAETARRWTGATSGAPSVRFVADVSVIARWSDAKA